MAATIPYYTVDDLDHFPDDGNRYEILDGVLLVTEGPEPWHQIILSRLLGVLAAPLLNPERAFVLLSGVVSFPPRSQLVPDLLVTGAHYPVRERWEDVRDYWLAVEVYSPSSLRYDRDFKRDNYHRLGVPEVWLVDRENRSVEISRAPGAGEHVSDVISWRLPTVDVEVRIELADIFAGIE